MSTSIAPRAEELVDFERLAEYSRRIHQSINRKFDQNNASQNKLQTKLVQLLLSSRAKNATEGHLENFSSVLKRSKESKQAVKIIFFLGGGGSGCGTTAEHMPHDQDVMGSNHVVRSCKENMSHPFANSYSLSACLKQGRD